MYLALTLTFVTFQNVVA